MLTLLLQLRQEPEELGPLFQHSTAVPKNQKVVAMQEVESSCRHSTKANETMTLNARMLTDRCAANAAAFRGSVC